VCSLTMSMFLWSTDPPGPCNAVEAREQGGEADGQQGSDGVDHGRR
jgi:hypothetical protein